MAKQTTSDRLPGLPAEPVQRWVSPFARFLHIEAASGVVLLVCTAVALGLANSPWAEAYLAFWKTPVGIQAGGVELVHSLKHWVNDGLMAIFFFVIGLEVKRELVIGELKDLRNAVLPIAGAIGGMVVPAGIYLAIQYGQDGVRGWGIPMATDIAFVVGCMTILGARVPHALRVMVLSLAIAVDIGAILVIAVGYTEEIQLSWLLSGAAAMAFVIVMARIGVRSVPIYFVVGVVIWFAFHESGVHATIAGVILGLATPAKSWVHAGLLGEIVDRARELFYGGEELTASERYSVLRRVEQATRESLTPLERLENSLHPWVGFAIMPIFALANAGIPFTLADLGSSVAIAVAAGLVIGKPIGILLVSWLAVKSGVTQLPKGVNWIMIAGGGMLAGIGFTMALFISGLALEGSLLDQAKIGVLAASAVSAIGGITVLTVFGPKRVETTSEDAPDG